MDRIFLEGMAFFARHGVHPAERESGQRFVVDVTLYVDVAAAGRTDDIARTIDYVDVYRRVEAVVCGRSFQLIEALAEAVAAAILAEFPVWQVGVRVKKPGAPLPGYFESVGVEILRTKSHLVK
uniref:7,8-dihydroneopterin aldolase n=1 Tax=Ammonifex degensii TaxID=42838 RepID=A0A7C1J817_9THEO